MKKLALLLVLAWGLTLTGQRHQGERNGMRDLNPEQMATLQTKRMTLALDLNQDQQTEIKSFLLSNATDRQQKMEERKVQKEGGSRPTKEERFAMQNERLDHMIAQKAKMKKILTETQFEKWEKMRHKRQKGKKSRGNRKPKR